MVNNLTKNWKGIKFIGMLSFLMLFFPVFSRGDTSLKNNVVTIEEKVTATITGTVTSTDDGQPLIGVNILIRGTSIGTVTDLDGNYSIEANEGDILEFSYTGFQNQEITVGAQTVINVSLSEGQLLDEVVVVGYGTRKKSHNTGAIAQVGGEDVAAIQAARVDDALAGKLSGVLIQNQDGAPGAAPKMLFMALEGQTGLFWLQLKKEKVVSLVLATMVM